ncbi:Hypothetical_protein [Hexamita inflata]|uniref:Hypothetical_protein n=1 Tax=Hexamita inflata TaxID=28002 RepID=A0AA86P1U2_9EUKA|nr:Hypothetical protein HINF_LOCUS18732 [Hexamita inflata]
MQGDLIQVVKGFKSRQEETLSCFGDKIFKDNSYNQLIIGDYSVTFYCDIDNEKVDIIQQLQLLTAKFGNDKIFYVLKSDLFDKYHIFCHDLVFENNQSLKYVLNQITGLAFDPAVYGSTQLFRLIGQSKDFNKSKGIYNTMYLFEQGELKQLQKYFIYPFVIHQGYKVTYKVEIPYVHQQIEYREGSESEEIDSEEIDLKLNFNINIISRTRVIAEQLNAETNTYDNRRKFAYFVYNLTKRDKQETIQIIKQFVDENLFKRTFGNIDYIQFINGFK